MHSCGTVCSTHSSCEHRQTRGHARRAKCGPGLLPKKRCMLSGMCSLNARLTCFFRPVIRIFRSQLCQDDSLVKGVFETQASQVFIGNKVLNCIRLAAERALHDILDCTLTSVFLILEQANRMKSVSATGICHAMSH